MLKDIRLAANPTPDALLTGQTSPPDIDKAADQNQDPKEPIQNLTTLYVGQRPMIPADKLDDTTYLIPHEQHAQPASISTLNQNANLIPSQKALCTIIASTVSSVSLTRAALSAANTSYCS